MKLIVKADSVQRFDVRSISGLFEEVLLTAVNFSVFYLSLKSILKHLLIRTIQIDTNTHPSHHFILLAAK